jgi:hypothetical protein
MEDRSLPVDAYCTAVAFLAQFLWVFPDNLTPEDFSCLFHSFLQAFGKCLQDFLTPWKADAILEFTSHGFHCLARFFSQDMAVGVNFVQELDPVTFMACFHSGLSVLQMSIPEADLATTKKNVRIVKAFRKTIEFLVQKSTWRLVKDPIFKIDFSRHLVDVLCTIISSVKHRSLKSQILVLLQQMNVLSPELAPILTPIFTPEFLIAAAMLTPDDLMEFTDVPVDYLNDSLLFSPRVKDNDYYSPRSTLRELFDAMDRDHIYGLIAALWCKSSELRDLEREAMCFIVDRLASSAEISLPDSILASISQCLWSGPSSVEAATLLTCLCRSDPSSETASDYSALACRYIQSPDAVVQHAALALFASHTDLSTVDQSPLNFASLLCTLAVRAWHEHLLILFTDLVNGQPDLFVNSASTILSQLCEVWLSTEGQDSHGLIILICALVQLLPVNDESVQQCAIWLGGLFAGLTDCAPDLMNLLIQWAITVATQLTFIPPEFFEVLQVCAALLAQNPGQFIAKVTELCALLIRSETFCQFPDASEMVFGICGVITGMSQPSPEVDPSFIPFALLVSASLLQARGPEMIELINAGLPYLQDFEASPDIGSAALILVSSGIIVLLDDDMIKVMQLAEMISLELWSKYVPVGSRCFGRAAKMSIIALLAMAEIPDALQMAFRQIANLDDVEPSTHMGGVERIVLAFDGIHIPSAMCYFLETYSSALDTIAEICDRDGFLGCLLPKGSVEPLGCESAENPFLCYLSKFFRWKA